MRQISRRVFLVLGDLLIHIICIRMKYNMKCAVECLCSENYQTTGPVSLRSII